MPIEPGLLSFLLELGSNEETHRRRIAGQALEAPLALLRNWQSRRLASTYADLLDSAQYGPACRFFLSDIYAAKDFSQRDADAEHIYDLLSRFLPAYMLRLLAGTIELNQLSHELDEALAQALVEKLGVTDTITPELYAEGYRLCDNYTARKLQIELLAAVLEEAATGAHSPLVGITLRLARTPAHVAGWHDLHGFLERGYQACKPMRKVSFFVNTIQEREMEILEKIFARHEAPFAAWNS